MSENNTNDNSYVEIDIECQQDYITNFLRKYCMQNHLSESQNFIFKIRYNKTQEKNLLLFRNYCLLRERFGDKIKLDKDSEVMFQQDYRVNTYLFNYLRYRSLLGVRKLFPAIFIKNDEDLKFFQNPIDSEVLEKILPKINNEVVRIKRSTFKTGVNVRHDIKMANKFWFVLRSLQNYLLGEFEAVEPSRKSKSNKSLAYTDLRNQVFRNNKFKEKIKEMPLLAVLLFAQYDYFYRNRLLTMTKMILQTDKLNDKDIRISEQGEQTFERYILYKKYRKEFDIKTLTQQDRDTIILHRDLMAELYESMSIAEGLLQIIENAVYYAGGGLLSMHIFEKNNAEDMEYLLCTYGNNYFNSVQSNFYLEIDLTDLSQLIKGENGEYLGAMPIMLWENMLRNTKSDFRLYESIKSAQSLFDYENYFGQKNQQFNEILRDYYKKVNNRLYHYGLQIFDSVVASKNGIFIVCGHGEIYKSNNSYFNDTNENMNDDPFGKGLTGTSYRILLPLRHAMTYDANVAPYTEHSEPLYSDELGCLIIEDSKIAKHYDKCIEGQNSLSSNQDKKIFKINNISNAICKHLLQEMLNKDFYRKHCLCFDMGKFLISFKPYGINLEVLIKGILKAAVEIVNLLGIESEDLQFPIALVNLDTHLIIEAARIISLFYDKNGDSNMMKDLQIYLLGNNVEEEVIFSHGLLEVDRRDLMRTAATRGSMFEYINIVNCLMKRRGEQ